MADTPISPTNAFGVANVIIPADGPKISPLAIPFSVYNTQELNCTLLSSQGKMDKIQGAYIDNGDNLNALTITVEVTGQRIIVPPFTQGYYPIFAVAPLVASLVTPTAPGLVVGFSLYNVPIQAQQWSTSGSANTVNIAQVGGVGVGDALPTQSFPAKANALTAPSATTITAGGTSQVLFAANAARKGWYLQNQSTGSLWVRRGVAATADQASLLVPAGTLYEAPVVTGESLNIIGATTGQIFHAREY